MRQRLFVVGLGLCLATGFCGWLLLRTDSVSLALSEQMRRWPGTTIDFAEIAPFAWDRVYVFEPYTSHQHIHTSLGFHWNAVGKSTINGNKGVNLVVFVRDAKVVHWFEHARSEELMDLADPNGYAREQAKFNVYVHRIGAESRLGLAPPKR